MVKSTAKPTTLIIAVLVAGAIHSAIHFETEELKTLLQDQNYLKILARICPVKPDGRCLPSLERTFAKKTRSVVEITKPSSHSGYTSKIYNNDDLFAVKHITVENPEMFPYVFNEINTGMKIKASMGFNAIENLVPVDQCCSHMSQMPGNSLQFSFFVRMPYYPIGSLRSFIENPDNFYMTKSFIWVWNIVDGLIEGLSVVHDGQYAHRDIKPENVLLKSYYTPAISDYGFAKMISEWESTILGTPAYIAPEMIKTGTYTQKADIYSLGIIIFELFNVGYFSIKEKSRSEIEKYCSNNKFAAQTSEFNQNIYCQYYKPLVDHMTEEDPAARYDITQAKAEFKKISAEVLNSLTEQGRSYFNEGSTMFLLDANNRFRMFMGMYKAYLTPSTLI